jgi:hypothetical protein
VQRRRMGLGFDTKVNGKFDDSTRAVSKRWRRLSRHWLLNQLQHKASPFRLSVRTAAALVSLNGHMSIRC